MELQDIKEYREKVKAAQFEAGAKMFLEKLISNLEVSEDKTDVYYTINNEIIVEYSKKENSIYYDYYKIHEVLEKVFNLDEIKIKSLVLNIMKIHLKIMSFHKEPDVCCTIRIKKG